MNFEDLRFTEEGIARANLKLATVNNALLNCILDILIKENDLDEEEVINSKFDGYLKDVYYDLTEFTIKDNN